MGSSFRARHNIKVAGSEKPSEQAIGGKHNSAFVKNATRRGHSQNVDIVKVSPRSAAPWAAKQNMKENLMLTSVDRLKEHHSVKYNVGAGPALRVNLSCLGDKSFQSMLVPVSICRAGVCFKMFHSLLPCSCI